MLLNNCHRQCNISWMIWTSFCMKSVLTCLSFGLNPYMFGLIVTWRVVLVLGVLGLTFYLIIIIIIIIMCQTLSFVVLRSDSFTPSPSMLFAWPRRTTNCIIITSTYGTSTSSSSISMSISPCSLYILTYDGNEVFVVASFMLHHFL